MSARKTMVGNINEDVLSFTVGKDPQLDAVLLEWDCIGTAAHVSMLQHVPLATPLFTATDRDGVVSELLDIMRQGRQGRFRITRRDQDVHLAVERALTRKLGTLGKRVHTGRSRNDQVAVDLRLYAKNELLGLLSDVADLATALLGFARRHRAWPMVGRTHLQPGMPSTVDLWASAYAEGLLEVRFPSGGAAAFAADGYQLALFSIDLGSDYVIDPPFFEEEDFEDLARMGSSPALLADDGKVRLPWFSIYYQGRHVFKVYTVDLNWYDLVRSTPQTDGGLGFGGNVGETADRPIFRVEGGIGLFGSASVDSVGFFVLPNE